MPAMVNWVTGALPEQSELMDHTFKKRSKLLLPSNACPDRYIILRWLCAAAPQFCVRGVELGIGVGVVVGVGIGVGVGPPAAVV